MSRRYQQFFYSFTHGLVGLHGSINMSQEVKAVKVTQGITLTAVAFGAAGNSITIAFTGGGTAGSEVVSVVGNAISVQIQSGVSSVTQVRTAINASGAAAALVVATGTSASTVATATALPLLGGVDGESSFSILGVASVSQTAVGEITIVLSDVWKATQSLEFQVQSATAQDLIPQIKSVDLPNKTIVVNLLASGVNTDPLSAIVIYMRMLIRSSTVTI